MLRYILPLLLALFALPLLAQGYADSLSFGGIGTDVAYGFAADASGNTYGVYHFDGTVDVQPGGGHSMTGFYAGGLVKYDSTHSTAWSYLLEPVNPGDMVIPEMPAVDSAGNVYVVGRFVGSVDFDAGSGTAVETALDTGGAAATYNAFLLKVDATGAFQWVRVLPGSYSWGARIACTSSRVCISGLYSGTIDLDPTSGTNYASTAGLSAFEAMFDASGTLVWAQANFGNGLEIPSQPVITAGDEVTLVMSFIIDVTLNQTGPTFTPIGNADMLMIHYTASGAVDWVSEVGGAGANVVPTWLSPGPGGDLYVTGNWRGTADFDPGAGAGNQTATSGLDAFVTRYDGNGNLVWFAGLACSGDTTAFACAADSTGVVVSGSFSGSLDADPGAVTRTLDSAAGLAFAVRLDANGGHVWSVNFGGTSAGGVETQVYGMASDGAGTVVIGGPYKGSADWDPGIPTVSTTAVADRDGWVLWLDDSSAGPSALQIVTAGLPDTSEGTAVNQDITAQGGSGSGYQWSIVSGQLPPGVSGIPGSATPTITLSGTPTTAGTYSFRLRVQDDAANSDEHDFAWVVNAPGTGAVTTTGVGGGGGGCTSGTATALPLLLFVLLLGLVALRPMLQRQHGDGE